ncbi:MAG: hypothetical protein PHR51_01990 [Patescibacteria group bacterium]|nr:hypothetical protein [Patescibacteria group bacterium]
MESPESNIIDLSEFRNTEETRTPRNPDVEPADTNEIIEFKKPEHLPEPDKSSQEQPSRDILLLRVLDQQLQKLATPELVWQMGRLDIFLDELRPTSSNDTIAMRRALVKEYSTAKLISSIVESDESNWQSHPTFYQAALRELRKRGLPF